MIAVAEPNLGRREEACVARCIRLNSVSAYSRRVDLFEKRFSQFLGCRHAVATVSGTAALHLAMEVLGIGEGDEVIVPTLTFIAAANAVSYAGARPVFADSEMKTWNIDPREIEKRITRKTKAVIPVHLYGQPADMGPVMKIARQHDLFVVEDATESLGASYKGRHVGTMGDIGVFSFNGNKLITTGGGGMLVTGSRRFAEKARILSVQGRTGREKWRHGYIGYNYRMTGLAASLGLAQLGRIRTFISAKRAHAAQYRRLLERIRGIAFTPGLPEAESVFWLYSILVEEPFGTSRDRLMERLRARGIMTTPFFYPCHLQVPYRKASRGRFPVAEYLSRKGLNLPSSTGLTKEEVTRVAGAIRTLAR